MITEINLSFNRFLRCLEVTAKENGKKEVYIKENEIKNFWHYNDAFLINSVLNMLGVSEQKLNKKYNHTYLVSKFFINGGDKTSLKISNTKAGTIVEYYNPEYWGKPVEGVANKFPAVIEPVEAIKDLPISCALVNKKYAQYFVDKITAEIEEFTKRKAQEMKTLIHDIDTLYGLKEDSAKIDLHEVPATPKQKSKLVKAEQLENV